MQDVMEVADRMVVMLRGRAVADVPRAAATVEGLVTAIIGAGEMGG